MNFFQVNYTSWINLDNVKEVWVKEETKHSKLYFILVGDTADVTHFLTGKETIEEFLNATNIAFNHEFY